MALAGLKSAFNNARSGLHAQLTGLNVTGHNISNVNTEGYSRQDVVLAPKDPMKTVKFIFGTGVEETAIRRMRDSFIDKQFRVQSAELNRNQTLEKNMEELQTIFNEPSETGLRYQLSSFFDAWQDLSNDPENEVTRYNIRAQADVLSDSLHRVSEQLDIMGETIDFETEQKIKTVNDLSTKIADLNVKIKSVEGGGAQANDLRDERDRNIDSLSELIDASYLETTDGKINIFAGGVTLVSGSTSLPLVAERYNTGNGMGLRIKTHQGLELDPKNGQLSALFQVRNTIIPKYKEDLNKVAASLIQEVNNVHQQGVGIKGSLNEMPHGNDFFSGTNAADIGVSEAVTNDVSAIAVAKREDIVDEFGNTVISGSPGNNEIGLQIAELKRGLVLNNSTISIPDSFNVIIGNLGIEANKYKDLALNQKSMLNQFQTLRESASAVSLDEEFTNLILYQRAYQASARVITTVSDMYETLLNMI